MSSTYLMVGMIDLLHHFVRMDTKSALFCAVVYAHLVKHRAAGIFQTGTEFATVIDG